MAVITRQKTTMHSPTHPREIRREMYRKRRRVSIAEASEALGVSRKHISAIVNGRAPMTPNLAIWRAAAFATEARLWKGLRRNMICGW